MPVSGRYRIRVSLPALRQNYVHLGREMPGKVCESHGSTVWDVKYLVTVEQKDFSLLNGHKRPAQA